MKIDYEDVLAFWFGPDLDDDAAVDAHTAKWFVRDAAFDEEITRRFGRLPERAATGALDIWRSSPRSALALVLALDQLPRNLFRGSDRAFDTDPLALEVALGAIEKGFDRELHPIEAAFFYMPLEHAEDLESQDRCVSLFDALAERCSGNLAERIEQYRSYAVRHRDVIRKFGRFPHRNALLGRESSAEESTYLTGGGETFGGGQATSS